MDTAFLLIATYMGLYWVLRGQIGRAPFAFLVVALALVLFEDRFRARPSALTLGFALMLVPLLMGGYRRMGAAGRVAVAVLALPYPTTSCSSRTVGRGCRCQMQGSSTRG